ncbi:MAG: response regulator transcription factor [Planctomycetota bacterium]|nr:response regulator transcription factor [Planctomycetota bacterium]
MRVLVIEDEVDLASALQRALREEGYACDVAHDGRTGVLNVVSWDYDLVVLDLMLPGLGGLTVLHRLRDQKPTPVLVLTARDALADKVALLDAGADDYLTKPFELAELLARVRSLIRRAAHEPGPKLEVNGLEVDLVAREVTRDGIPVPLTPKEYALVEYLVLHRGEVITRTRIYEHLYDEHEDTLSNVVDVYVSNVRKKLGREFVRTRRGEGYIVDAG